MDMFGNIRTGVEVLTNHGLLAAIVSGIVTIGFALLIWLRTRSTHSLMSRLWRLFHGRVECKDKEIGQFLDQQSALMEFRFTTGIPVRTKWHAKELIAWTSKHGEDIGHVAACGHYFDLEKICLKSRDQLPNLWSLGGRYLGALAMLLVCLCLVIGIFFDRAFLQIKKSGTYFTLSVEYAKGLRSDEVLTREQCLNGRASQSKIFNKNDAEVICGILRDEGMADYLAKVIKEQRVAISIGAVFFARVGWGIFAWLMQGVRAREMLRRQERRNVCEALALVDSDEDFHDGKVASGCVITSESAAANGAAAAVSPTVVSTPQDTCPECREHPEKSPRPIVGSWQ